MNKKNNSKLGIKILMGIVSAIVVASGVYFLIEMYVIKKPSYFTEHFLLFICLFCLGIDAMLLPTINRKKFSGDGKGDSLIIVVGFLLIICAIISIISSYIMNV